MQIHASLLDNQRELEKSRMPFSESNRIGKTAAGGGGSEKSFDEEIYDDRQFYSMLLKVCYVGIRMSEKFELIIVSNHFRRT